MTQLDPQTVIQLFNPPARPRGKKKEQEQYRTAYERAQTSFTNARRALGQPDTHCYNCGRERKEPAWKMGHNAPYIDHTLPRTAASRSEYFVQPSSDLDRAACCSVTREVMRLASSFIAAADADWGHQLGGSFFVRSMFPDGPSLDQCSLIAEFFENLGFSHAHDWINGHRDATSNAMPTELYTEKMVRAAVCRLLGNGSSESAHDRAVAHETAVSKATEKERVKNQAKMLRSAIGAVPDAGPAFRSWLGGAVNPTTFTSCDDNCHIHSSNGIYCSRWTGCPGYNSRHGRLSASHGVPFISRLFRGSKRLVGLEVEYNGGNKHPTGWIQRWHGNVHEDGSCGFEAVTTPIAGRHILPCLLDLTKEMRLASTKADERCSVHVHVDARDVSWHDMMRLVDVYKLIEPMLYVIGGQSRAYNSYSKACGAKLWKAVHSATDMPTKKAMLADAVLDGHNALRNEVTIASWTDASGKRHIRDIHRGEILMRTRPGKKHGSRYKGMNLVPWLVGRRSGAPDTTVEFRIHRNSLDARRLASWALMLARIVDYACEATDKEVAALPKSALRALCQIAPLHKDWILSRVKAWRKATTVSNDPDENEVTGDTHPVRGITVVGGLWVGRTKNRQLGEEL